MALTQEDIEPIEDQYRAASAAVQRLAFNRHHIYGSIPASAPESHAFVQFSCDVALMHHWARIGQLQELSRRSRSVCATVALLDQVDGAYINEAKSAIREVEQYQRLIDTMLEKHRQAGQKTLITEPA